MPNDKKKPMIACHKECQIVRDDMEIKGKKWKYSLCKNFVQSLVFETHTIFYSKINTLFIVLSYNVEHVIT